MSSHGGYLLHLSKVETGTGTHPEIFKEGGSDKGSRQKWPILLLLKI